MKNEATKQALTLNSVLDKYELEKLGSGLLKTSVNKAFVFALAKHNGQYRITGEPFIFHPIHVFKYAMEYTDDLPVLQAALLHDTLEDTQTSTNELNQNFGVETTSLVKELTLPKGLKRTAKAKYIAKKVITVSNGALLLKLCDRLDNVCSLNSLTEYHADLIKNDTYLMLDSLLENRDITPAQEDLIERIYISLEK